MFIHFLKNERERQDDVIIRQSYLRYDLTSSQGALGFFDLD